MTDQIHGHGRLMCRHCHTVIAQCRCLFHDKVDVSYGVCNECKVSPKPPVAQKKKSEKKLSLHKIEVRSKNPGRVMTGLNTELLIDGKLLKGCRSFKFEVRADGVANITLEMVADVSIAAILESKSIKKE